MFLRNCAFAAVWVVLGLFVLRHPDGAADTVKAALGGLALMADALARFASAF